MQFKEFYSTVLSKIVSDHDSLPYPVRKVYLKKNEIITKYGQVEDTVYFLNSGVVEMTIKSYMIEKAIDFFFDNDMFTSLTSLLTKLPSDVQIKALTECEAEVILLKDLEIAYHSSLSANIFGRIIIEQAYIKKARREKDFLTKTAEERYSEMLQTHKQYISKIPVNKIAKYLGVHPESLSRIRKKIIS